jgi:small GTP-binding protein
MAALGKPGKSKNILKICIMGEGGTGKTTLTQRVITGQFNPTTKMTIGIDFQLLKTSIFDPSFPEDADEVPQVEILAQIWDFGGEERFRFILPRYCKGAVAGLLLYDLSRFSTTRYINDWFKIWTDNSPKDAPIFLIGSKSDLLNENDLKTALDSIKDLASELNIKFYYIISSKSGNNIHIMTNELLRQGYLFNLTLL